MTETEKFHVNMNECAELLDTTTETLRKVVAKSADNGFPVVERGQHGVSYVIDGRAAAAWWKANKEARDAAQDARVDELQQLRLELFGGELGGEDAERFKLSGRLRRDEIEAEFSALKLSRARGELCEAAEVERVFVSAMTALRQELMAVPDRLAKRLNLTREQRALADEIVGLALDNAAQRLETAETYSAAA